MKKTILFLSACVFIQLAGCGPSKAELEAAAKKAVDEAQDTTATTQAVSTDPSTINVERVAQIVKPDGKGGGSLRFITADGHEYIQWYTAGDGSGSAIGVSMCHNENCPNESHHQK